MFFLFCARMIRKDHVSTVVTPFDQGEGYGSARYMVTVSLTNGERISEHYGEEGEAHRAYVAVKNAIGANIP